MRPVSQLFAVVCVNTWMELPVRCVYVGVVGQLDIPILCPIGVPSASEAGVSGKGGCRLGPHASSRDRYAERAVGHQTA